jgi:hypothetical protein
MAHTHDHEPHSAEYLDQLAMIATCAALGGVCLLLYQQGALGFLVETFRLAVLLGGVGLLAFAVLRGLAVWRGPSQTKKEHHNEHGVAEACCQGDEHAHTAAGQAHAHGQHRGDGHEHGWAPVRYAVLLLPITLFFLGIPNPDFIRSYANYQILYTQGDLPPLFAVWFLGAVPSPKSIELDEESPQVAAEGGELLALNWTELAGAAFDPMRRDFYEGKSGMLKGLFHPGPSDRDFTLVRMKVTCCYPDAVPLLVAIVSPEPITDIQKLDWIEVTGQIQFRKLRGREDYIPVLQLRGREAIRKVPPDPDPAVY